MADQLGPAIHNTGLLTSMAQQNRRLEANQAELKNKNAELEESEARLDSIIAIVPDIIYRLDRDGKITFISDAISRYDYHPEEMVGRHYLDLVCEEDEDKATWRMNERRTGDRSTKALEIRLRPSKNNNKTDVGSNRTPVLLISAEGLYTSPQIGEKSWRGTQGVARDITDHKLLEEQLLQAHKMEAVGQLAGGIAHDFDNMLMAILTTCHFIKSDWQGEKALLEDVEIIREAGSKAARLTQQILAFSRQQVFTPELLDLNDVVRQTETMLGRLLAEDVSLTFAAGDDIGKITADRLQIERVIINLAVNASDAMPRGGRLSLQTGEVHLGENDGTHQEEILPGPYVLLRVTDSGEGLDAQTQQQMFEPFFTTKEQGHGTGMGLSMVYGIVKQSGGHVRVDSKKGVGTEFTIYLPRADDSQVAASTPMVDPEQVQEGSETILLVEDEDIVRRPLVRFLEKLGYAVLQADSAEQALRLYEHDGGRVDLLLTDVVMPGMNGRELAEQIQAQDARMPVVFMSGYTDAFVNQRGLLQQDVILLAKPVLLDQLALKLRQVLDAAAL